MSVQTGSALRQFANLAQSPEGDQSKEKATWEKILLFVNRETAASASFVDELIFDDTDMSAVDAWLEGIKGRGRVQSFNEILTKAGWQPESKAGKIFKGIAGFTADVAGSPSSYVGLGIAPKAKAFQNASKILSAATKKGSLKAKNIRRAKAALRNEPKAVQQAAEFVFRNIDSPDEAVRGVAKRALQGKRLSKVDEARLGLRDAVALQSILGGPSLGLVPKGASVALFRGGEALFNQLEKTPLVSPVIHGVGKAFNQWYDLKKKHPEVFEARRRLQQRLGHLTADATRRVLTFWAKLGNKAEAPEILELLERPTATKIIDMTETIKKYPTIWTDVGLRPGQDVNPEQAAGLVENFFKQQDQWVSEFGPEQLYRGGVSRLKAQSLTKSIAAQNEILQGIERRISQLKKGERPEFQGELRQMNADAKRNREASDALSEELANLEKQNISEFPELNDVLDEAYTQELGTGFYGTVKEAGDLENFQRIGFQGYVIKIPRSLEDVDLRFGEIVEEAKAYNALAGPKGQEIPGIGRATLVWRNIPVKRVINENVAKDINKLDQVINATRQGTNDLTPGDLDGLLARRRELMRHQYQHYVPGFQIVPRKGTGALGAEGEFAATTAEGLKGDPHFISGASDRFVRTDSAGRTSLRMPVLVKQRVKVDEHATELFKHASLGSRTNDVVRQIEGIMARVSRRGIVLGNMHLGNFGLEKVGKDRFRVKIMDIGNTGGAPQILQRAGDTIDDDDVMRAWFGNMYDGLFGDTIETQVLRSQDSINQYSELMRAAQRQFAEGNVAAARGSMNQVENLLARHGYRMSKLKFENVLGTRTGVGKATRDRIARRLAQRSGMSIVAARQLVNRRAKDLSGLRSEVGLTHKIVEGRLDELDRAILEQEEILRGAADPETQQLAADSLTALRQERASLSQLEMSSEDIIKTRQKGIEVEVEPAERLSPEGVEAYRYVKAWNDQLQEKLLDSGLLTQEVVDNFRKRLGLQHVRHFKKHDVPLTRQMRDAIRDMNREMRMGNLKRRDIEGTLKEIQDRLGTEFMESDIGRIMFMSHLETGRAVENWNYIRWLRDNFSEPAERQLLGGEEKFFANKVDHVVISDHPLLREVQLPKAIAQDVRNLTGKVREDTTAATVAKYFDQIQNWWKKWQLFAFPSYFLRNYVGAIWNNFLADVSPASTGQGVEILLGPGIKRRALVGATGGAAAGVAVGDEEGRVGRGILGGLVGGIAGGGLGVRKALKDMDQWGVVAAKPNQKVRGLGVTNQQLLDEANEQGVLSRGQFGAKGDIERTAHAQYLRISRNPLRLLDPRADKNTLIRLGMKVNEQLENGIRLGHYLAKRRKGFSPEDAAMSVKKFQFDYDDLSDFERNALKRVFPFYTWTRNNVPLQVQMLLQRPGKFTALGKAINTIQTQAGGEAPPSAIVPKWLNENLGLRYQYDKKTGQYEYWLLGSWLPAADLMRMFHPAELVKDMASPFLKTPAEQAFNKSLFFDRPLEEVPGETRNLLSPEAGRLAAQAPGASEVDKLLKATFGDNPFIGAVQGPLEEGVQVRGRAENVLRQFRGINEIRRFLETSSRQGTTSGALAALLGKTYGFDPKRAKEFDLFARAKEIRFLQNEMRKAVRKGQTSKALELKQKIIDKRKELRQVSRLRVGGRG
jgi:hypothetical protein